MKLINDIMVITKSGKKIAKESLQAKDALGGQWIEPRYNYNTVSNFYDWNSWHRRCILIKAAVACGLGWEIVCDDDDKNPDQEYNLLDAFLRRPNPEMSFNQLAFRSGIDYFHWGNVFVEVVANKKGTLAEMYHAPAGTMRVGTNSTSYWQLRFGKMVEFAKYGMPQDGKNEIMHLATYDPKGDYYGMPDWIPAMATMTLDRNAVSWNVYNFENEFMGKQIMFFKGAQLSKEVKLRLKNFFQSQFKGIENAGRTVVIDVDDPNVDLKVERLQADIKDLSFLESRAFNRDEVIQAHNVPPRLLGIISAGQLGGGGETEGQLKVFKAVTIAPHKEYLENFFNRILSERLQLKKWRVQFSELDITTVLDDAQFVEKVQSFLSDDEAREVLGYKPRDQKQAEPAAAETNKEKNNLELLKALVKLRKSLEEEE